MKGGSISQTLSTQALQPISNGFTYILQQRRKAGLAPDTTLQLGRIDLPTAAVKGDSVSRPLSTQALHSNSAVSTYTLQQRRRAGLAPDTTLHLGRIDLPAAAEKEGSVSRPLSTQALLRLRRIHLHSTTAKEGRVSP